LRIPALGILIFVILIMMASGTTMAHEDEDDDHMHDDDHMWGGWNMPGAGFMIYGYWILAMPIALLAYVDAVRKDMNGAMWAVLILIPWVGILAMAAYVGARSRVGRSPEPTYGGHYNPPYQRRDGEW
jgi:hypothetical protein